MAQHIADLDAYGHPIVVHTYPDQQDKVYRPLARRKEFRASRRVPAEQQRPRLSFAGGQVGACIRRGRNTVDRQLRRSPAPPAKACPPTPATPACPENFDNPSIDDTRKYALWGTLMAGGGGVEYYFGYKLPQNDLVCEDWRSRDRSWDYCRIALDFFRDHAIPFHEMTNADQLVGNPKHDNSAYCFAKPGSLYLVYLPDGGERVLDLKAANGSFEVHWFNPRTGGELLHGGKVAAGNETSLSAPDSDGDWLAAVRRVSK